MDQQLVSASSDTSASCALDADVPLQRPGDDRLDRRRFAAWLARTISTMDTTHGFVLGLHGSWGSGKSSVLNFVRHYLRHPPDAAAELATETEDGRSPVIVDFNPWWFSGSGELLTHFFSHLAATIREPFASTALKDLHGLLLNYGPSVSPAVLSLISPEHATVATGLGVVSAVLARRRSRRKTAAPIYLRDQICEKLSQAKRPILIIMDDIDRLRRDEIQQIFRLVRAVADFPNIVYLLAFDSENVARALEEAYPAGGRDYLDKVVQAPFDLPPPDPFALSTLLDTQVDPILAGTPPDLFDVQEWGNIYQGWLRPALQTPRQVTRYLNAVRATYPGLRGEVNAVDFLAIESLRVFAPAAYDFVRRSKDLFAGHCDTPAPGGDDRAALRGQFEEGLFTTEPPTCPPHLQAPMRELLSRLFPRFAWACEKGSAYGSDFIDTWRQGLRACSLELFDLYFQFAVPAGAVSASEVRGTLALARDPKALAARLVTFAQEPGRSGHSTRVYELLLSINTETREGIPPEHIEPIVRALFDVGDRLIPSEERHGGGAGPVETHIWWIVGNLLRRLDSRRMRADILLDAIQSGESMLVPARLVSVYGDQHTSDRTPDPERVVPADTMAELTQAALHGIKEGAQTGSLKQAPHLPFLMYRWREWEIDPGPNAFLHALASNDTDVPFLLEGFLYLTKALGLGAFGGMADRVWKRTPRVRPSDLQNFGIDTAALVVRALRILDTTADDLTETQRQALEAFLDEHEHPEKYEDGPGTLQYRTEG